MKIDVNVAVLCFFFCIPLLSCVASESTEYSPEKVGRIVSAPAAYDGKRLRIHGCVKVDRHGMLLVECGKRNGIAIVLSDAYRQKEEMRSFLQVAQKNWLPNVNSDLEADYYGEFLYRPSDVPRRIFVLHAVKNLKKGSG